MPGIQQVNALLCFAQLVCILGMLVNTESTAIDLRSAYFDQLFVQGRNLCAGHVFFQCQHSFVGGWYISH